MESRCAYGGAADIILISSSTRNLAVVSSVLGGVSYDSFLLCHMLTIFRASGHRIIVISASWPTPFQYSTALDVIVEGPHVHRGVFQGVLYIVWEG